MEYLLLVFIYASLLAFVFVTIAKALKFAKMPMHNRFELYPVPKEKGKGEYGGSYLEEVKWYEKPREVSFGGELKEMLKEMLFIKNLYVNQRSMWWLSYALHLGIYVLAVWTGMILIGGMSAAFGGPAVSSDAGGWAGLVYLVTVISGFGGAILLLVGAAGLFLRRMLMETMSKYTTTQDYFNLLFLFAVAGTGLLVAMGDASFQYGRDIFYGLLTFSPIEAGGMLTLHIILLGLLLIYIPQTKMSHYVAKYFTFHKVLWGNDPNFKGSDVEKGVIERKSFKPTMTWSAPHTKPPSTTPAPSTTENTTENKD